MMAGLPTDLRANIIGRKNGKCQVEIYLTVAWWAWPGLLWGEMKRYQWPWWRWPWVMVTILKLWLGILWRLKHEET